MAQPHRHPRPSAEQIRRFVAKLEAFAATLSDVEREMLRVALRIGAPAEGDGEQRWDAMTEPRQD
jgi:hypothetical protein